MRIPMQEQDKITIAEILFTAVLVVVFGLIWLRWPSIKVSSKTLESYQRSGTLEHAWNNGIGLTIKAKSLGQGDSLDPDFQPYKDLLQKYMAFSVSVSIEGATYPTMIDIPYERMKLTGPSGAELRPNNEALAEGSNDLKLRQVLEAFDWSIVNNTFTRQARSEKGLLLFDRADWQGGPVTLNLNVYHHPYKQINLEFKFNDPQGSETTEAASR